MKKIFRSGSSKHFQESNYFSRSPSQLSCMSHSYKNISLALRLFAVASPVSREISLTVTLIGPSSNVQLSNALRMYSSDHGVAFFSVLKIMLHNVTNSMNEIRLKHYKLASFSRQTVEIKHYF